MSDENTGGDAANSGSANAAVGAVAGDQNGVTGYFPGTTGGMVTISPEQLRGGVAVVGQTGTTPVGTPVEGQPENEPEREPDKPPRDGLFRARRDQVNVRSAADGKMPTLHGHFAVFNEWTEIDSLFEGRFMEKFAPGAFRKTFKESGDQMRALFQHGRDPVVGDKPLGPFAVLEEDQTGARYEVPLLDTTYNRDLIPGLDAGLYGASFRFRVVREDVNNDPERSDFNPEGIQERVVKEAEVMEAGPVTFPAYPSATAGVRSVSVTDEFIFQHFASEPERLRAVIAYVTRGDVPEGSAREEQEPSTEPSGDPEPEPSESTQPDDAEPDDAAPEGDAGESTPPPGRSQRRKVRSYRTKRRQYWRLTKE